MKDKRGDIRIPLLLEKVRVFTHFGQEEVFDEILEMADVAKGGAFFRSDKLLKPDVTVQVTLLLPGDLGALPLDGRVIRVAWMINKKKCITHKGFAVKFAPMTPGVDKIWDAYRIYLRNKQIITVSKRIIEEFFGQKGPKKDF